MKERMLMYRCRRCGETYPQDKNYPDEAEHAEAAMWALAGCPDDLQILEKEPDYETRLGCLDPETGLYSAHDCKDGGKGFSDFVGLSAFKE